ncbi:MAG: ribonuclease R [Fusobacteriaceae bacterium]
MNIGNARFEKDIENVKKVFLKNNTLKYEEILKLAELSPKFKKENRALLDEMVERGDLLRNNRGKYTTPERMGYVKGEFNIIKERFAFVDTPTEGIFVPRVHFGGALDGDTVLIKVKEGYHDKTKKEGEVVKVIKRNKDTIVGILHKKPNFGFVVPTHAFGKDIFIPYKAMKNADDNQLVVVKITFWGDVDKKPEGEVIEVLGEPGNTDNMMEAVIRREGMSEDFPDEALAEARKIPQVVTEEEISKRKDLRNLKIITIDGDDAKDLDDAVYVEKLANGGYKLIVAIADVAHYIEVGSALDKEAFKRGNSVYMVDRVLPMFPKEISNGICSLNPHTDKLTFSCEIIFDENGKVLSTDTYKSVINTVHRMTYSNVNKILAKDEEMLATYKDIVEEVKVMEELSALIRKLKYNRGSIDFDIPEIKVILDENKKVKELKKIERGESERIIEDFMIAANEALAEKIFWMEVPSIYRTHEKPDPERISKLNEILAKFKYRIHSLEDVHPKKFQKIIEDSKERGINLVVHKSILMALKQARYTKENSGHFGLASGYYTHFTSPIRRYADLMVHRIGDMLLKGYPTKKQLKWLETTLDSIALHISKTERDAMKVEDESKKIKIVEYMKDKVGEVYSATITGFSNRRIFFETDQYIECSWDTMGPNSMGNYQFLEHEYTMVETTSEKEYKLGDKIDILIVKADMLELTIEAVPNVTEEEN